MPLPCMNTADLEYLLQRTYFQGRLHSADLVNRENALASSTSALLAKISSETLDSQRKLVELGRCLLDTLEPGEEHDLTADAITRLEEEFSLMLAKHHKLPAVTNIRFSSRPESSDLTEIETQLAELLSPETDTAVASADSAFAQMHEEFLKSIGKGQEMDCDDDVTDLTQKVVAHSMTQPCNTGNFMTAKQALVKNSNNRTASPATQTAGSGYNPTAQMRRLGLGNKRPRPALEQPQPTDYRGDEGRDINTEFRYAMCYKMSALILPFLVIIVWSRLLYRLAGALQQLKHQLKIKRNLLLLRNLSMKDWQILNLV